MKKQEAINELLSHVRQCGYLMPIGWIHMNGDGSRFQQAMNMATEALQNAPPCRIGDVKWGIRRYRGTRKVAKGVVSEMFYTRDMKLCIVLRSVCRGRYGEKVFDTYEEAVTAMEGGATPSCVKEDA